jgi:hypothetical protein
MSQVLAIPISLGGTGATTAAQAKINLGISGGGISGTPLSIVGIDATGNAAISIPNSSFDATTGDVTLGATLQVIAPVGAPAIFFRNDSANGIEFYTTTAAPTYFESDGAGGFVLDATGQNENGTGTGPITQTSVGGINLTAQAYPTFAITAVDQGAKTFTIAGDKTALAGLQVSIAVAGSTGNDGNYTVVGLTLVGGDTVIEVSQAIPSAVADGTLTSVAQSGIVLSSVVPATLNGNPIVTALAGVTAAIGGSALTLGQQATADVVIAGASAAIAAGAVIQASPVTADAPGDGFVWSANLTATLDTIRVKVVCLVAGTPTSSVFNVKVF